MSLETISKKMSLDATHFKSRYYIPDYIPSTFNNFTKNSMFQGTADFKKS